MRLAPTRGESACRVCPGRPAGAFVEKYCSFSLRLVIIGANGDSITEGVLMPISYQIDCQRGVVFTQGIGTATDTELLEHNRTLVADVNFNPNYNQLLDFTDVTNTEVKSETINLIAGKRIFELSSRRAIV